jgi:Putative auto-transporter adhesin, head GIN domain
VRLSRPIALLVCTSAAASAWAQSAGEGERRSYAPGAFDTVVISGTATVRFTQGQTDEVTVEGDESVQRSVGLSTDGSRLMVSTSGSWKFWANRRIQLNVTARELKGVHISGSASFHVPQRLKSDQLSVSISGAGTVAFDQLQVDSLKFSVSGSGDGTAAGQARTVSVAVSGRGKFDGEHLESESAKVAISGIADVALWAQRELSVGVGGFGNVDYWGNPQVRRAVSGRADIRHRGDKVPTKP